MEVSQLILIAFIFFPRIFSSSTTFLFNYTQQSNMGWLF